MLYHQILTSSSAELRGYEVAPEVLRRPPQRQEVLGEDLDALDRTATRRRYGSSVEENGDSTRTTIETIETAGNFWE